METGIGLNQIGTLKWTKDTSWSSYLSSFWSLRIMLEATYKVLENIVSDWAIYTQRGDADVAYDVITSFKFVLILNLKVDIMEVA